MTYQEIKDKLTQCEISLERIKASSIKKPLPATKLAEVSKLQILKEVLENKLKESNSKTYLVTPSKGQTTAVSLGDDEKDALKDADDVKAIKGIDGEEIKERLNKNKGTLYSVEDTKLIAREVGKAVAKGLKALGDEINHMKAKHIEENSFEIYVEYKKNDRDDEFAFHIIDDSLHLADFSFNKKIGSVGTKPSGEPIVQVDVLANELKKHWQSLSEEEMSPKDVEFEKAKEAERLNNHPEKGTIAKIKALLAKEKAANEEDGDYNPDQMQKDDEEDHGVGYDDEGRPLGEGEGDDHHYIKVTQSDYKPAMAILDDNIDPTYVKMDVVDNDGAGNVIIYFMFKHEDGFDDMYDDSENPDSEFYQEPDEDPNAFMYDMVMDLAARGVDVVDSSHEHDVDETMDINDPVMLKVRQAKMHSDKMKKLDAYSKSPEGKSAARSFASSERKEAKAREIVSKLKIKRAQVMSDMENDPEIEPTGGPVADMYGDQLNKIDNAIEKAALVYNKATDYDTAVGKIREDEEEDARNDADYEAGWNDDPRKDEATGDGELVTFGYELDMIQQVVDHLQNNYKEGEDFELHIGRGDDLPNAVTLKNPNLQKDYDLNDMLNAAQSDEDRYDAYTEGATHPEGGPDQGGDLDIGHQDDEPNMIQKDLYDIAHYAAKLHQRLKKYDAHDGEVDFPHWWQKKVTLAREYISSAQHYLEAEENQPAMDQLALESVSEVSLNKIQKSYDQTISIMKDLAKKYKAGDKSVVDQLKTLTITKKKLEKQLDDKISGTGRDQELTINESASRDLDDIFGAIGYRQGFDEFIEDNPGAVEVLMDWIGSIPEFRTRIGDEYSKEEQEDLGFYYGDDDEDEYNESTVKEGRGDLDIIVRVITDMANEDGITPKEAALEVIEAIRDAYIIDAYDEGVIKENLNPEVSKKVNQFIKAMAKRYGYDEQDAVFAIKQALRLRGMGKEDAAELDENKILKEFTDNSFKGSELIDDANKRGPDMFGKQIFADLLPKGVASENDAIEALKKHDKSGIKARMGRYAPMFVHVQYHNLEHEGEDYRMHQTQYYNSNFKDKDPDFNPAVSKITLFKITKKAADRRDKEESDNLGTILVKTSEYVQDLNVLPGLGKRVSEAVTEVKVGDTLTKDGKKGKITKISDTQATVDFGNGDVYGIAHSRIKDGKILKESKTAEDLKAKIAQLSKARAAAASSGKDTLLSGIQKDISKAQKELKKLGKLSEATRQDLGMVSSISKRRAKAHLKNPSNDGSKVYGLDKDGKRVRIKSINDVDKFTKFEIDADLNEEKATYCGGCGTTHKKSSGCPKNEVNEASKERMIKQIKRALKDGLSIYKLPMDTQTYYNKHKDEFKS